MVVEFVAVAFGPIAATFSRRDAGPSSAANDNVASQNYSKGIKVAASFRYDELYGTPIMLQQMLAILCRRLVADHVGNDLRSLCKLPATLVAWFWCRVTMLSIATIKPSEANKHRTRQMGKATGIEWCDHTYNP